MKERLNTPEDVAAFQKAIDAMSPEDRAKLDTGMRGVMKMSPMSNPQPSVAVPVDLLSAILNDASTAAGLVSHARAQAIEGRVKQAEALLSAPQGPAEKLWCAMCGKWGDHGSGSCPELRLTKRVRELEAAIREHMPASEGLRAYASDEDRKLWAAVE